MTSYPTTPQPEDPNPMNNGVRIGLRLFGALMFIAGLGYLVLLVMAGPSTVADWMGEGCVNGDPVFADEESCTWQDVVEYVPAAGIMVLVGAVLVLVMRRPRRASRPGGLSALGGAR